MKKIYDTVTQIAEKLDVTGPMNVQFLLTKSNQLRVIEANVRSSRSVPFVSKTLGISFPAMMVSAFLAQPDHNLVPIKRAKMTHVGCKASMFSFNRLAGADPITGVEMASTGEVGVFGRSKLEVFLKAMLCQNLRVPTKGIFFSSDVDSITEQLCPHLSRLANKLKIYTSTHTAVILKDYGVPHEVLTQRHELHSNNEVIGENEQVEEVATYDTEVAKKEKFDMVVQLRDKKKDFMLRRCTRKTAPPDYWIRRLAVDYSIPLLTEENLVKLFCEAVEMNPIKMEIESFKHYVPKIYHKIENNNCAVLRNHKVGLLITNNNDSKVLALRLLEEKLDVTCFHAYLGGTNISTFESAFQNFDVPVDVIDLRSEIAYAAFDLIMCQCEDEYHNWHLSKLSWHIFGRYLLPVMAERQMTVVAQSSKQSKKELGFEKFVRMYAPHIGIYNAWRDSRLMEDFTSEADQIAYLRKYGVKATVKNSGEVHNSVCGITHYCKDIRDLPQPTYVKALRDCSETGEFVSITYRQGRCVNIDGTDVTPLIALQMANEIAGRNGVGVTRTREGAMYEAPGMRLLSTGLRFLYELSFDRPSADLFRTYSAHIAQQLSLGQYSEKHTQSAVEAVRYLASDVGGVVELELHKGDIIFLKCSNVLHPIAQRGNKALVTEEELEEVFQVGNGSFSDIQW